MLAAAQHGANCFSALLMLLGTCAGDSSKSGEKESSKPKAAKEAKVPKEKPVPAAKVPRAKNAFMIFAGAKRGEIKGEQEN